jgi:hypothetical protein
MHLQRPLRPSLLIVGFLAFLGLAPALTAGAQDATPIAAARPSAGFELHIDAKAHFPGDPEAIAHHYCKAFAEGMFECLLYAGDNPDALLVGVEVVVPAATYEGFDATEQGLWHYHKEEIPLVDVQLPELTAEEAAEVAAVLEETYGKVYLLWDPTASKLPTGQPFVHDVHASVGAGGTPTP